MPPVPPPNALVPHLNIPAALIGTMKTADPSRRALTFYAGARMERSLTFAEYAEAIERMAGHLRSLGVGKGDKVATLLRNRLEVPILYLGAMTLGAVVVPLNPAYTHAEMLWVVEDAGVKGVVTDAATLGDFGGCFAALSFVSMLDGGQTAPPVDLARQAATVAPSDPAIILYTSGTTSFPKGVVQCHANLIANATSMIGAMGIHMPNQYSIMPFYHAHAVGFGMMSCLLSQGHLIISERMDPRHWASIVRSEKVTVTSMVPNLLHLLVRTRLRQSDVPDLGFIFVSAAPLPSELARRFEEQSGIRLAHAWGLSEFTNFATCLPADMAPSIRDPLMHAHPTPCVGSALAGASVKVIDPSGAEVGENGLGELCVSGPSLTLGYHNNPEATGGVFIDGWMHSGDEGYFVTVEGTRYFFISDRIKDIIIRSGEKISPSAVETEIVERFPQLVNAVVVLGFPHDVYGEEVGLVVETADYAGIAGPLEDFLRAMPNRKRPKIVLHASSVIRRTHTGKIQRRMLRPLFESFAKSPANLLVKGLEERAEVPAA